MVPFSAFIDANDGTQKCHFMWFWLIPKIDSHLSIPPKTFARFGFMVNQWCHVQWWALESESLVICAGRNSSFHQTKVGSTQEMKWCLLCVATVSLRFMFIRVWVNHWTAFFDILCCFHSSLCLMCVS